MNSYMQMTVKAAIGYLQAFEQNMKAASLQDDGMTSKQEEKELKKINKLTEKYIEDLERLLD